MDTNASSTIGSAARQDITTSLATKEANKEKPNTAQEKAPSSPSSAEVVISIAGDQLSARAEASEESNAENSSDKNREANKTAEATRVQNNQIQEKELSAEKRIDKLNEAIQKTPSAVYLAQANVSAPTVEALSI